MAMVDLKMQSINPPQIDPGKRWFDPSRDPGHSHRPPAMPGRRFQDLDAGIRDRNSMINSRLRLAYDVIPAGLTFMSSCEMGGKVAVFVCTADGQYCTIEDESSLFPSDALITQLRLLIK